MKIVSRFIFELSMVLLTLLICGLGGALNTYSAMIIYLLIRIWLGVENGNK